MQMPLPQVDEGDKETRGRILIVGGSSVTPGAAILAGLAALRAGAGKLQVAIDEAIQPHVAIALPEAMVIPIPGGARKAGDTVLELFGRCDAAVIGPGMVADSGAGGLAAAMLAAPQAPPLVLDAGALEGLGSEAVRGHGRAILTPHAGEMAKLMDVSKETVLADPLAVAREAAQRFGAVVTMKGACTYIVDPGGSVLRHEDGVFGLATSGSGDTLAGIMGGLLARGADPLCAAAWGVYLHARAGAKLSEKVGPLGFLAREILDEIAPAMAEAAR